MHCLRHTGDVAMDDVGAVFRDSRRRERSASPPNVPDDALILFFTRAYSPFVLYRDPPLSPLAKGGRRGKRATTSVIGLAARLGLVKIHLRRIAGGVGNLEELGLIYAGKRRINSPQELPRKRVEFLDGLVVPLPLG